MPLFWQCLGRAAGVPKPHPPKRCLSHASGFKPNQFAVSSTTMDINSTLIAAVIFAFVIAFIFSMFGQGGGSVYSPLLITLGYAILLSTSTSLVLNLITSLSAGYIFYRKKMIDYKTSLIFAPGISHWRLCGRRPVQIL
ncbi:MAG: sulfite exporter TauE/SafE family protein [Comamonadaceae bacterium]|nr:sulfite exporter TauE/SafE family protein [Comamonadaceae bacterium]